jgi:hypothetical protein
MTEGGTPTVKRTLPDAGDLGQDRPDLRRAGDGGWVDSDLLARPWHLIGCAIHSADRIVPEWQEIKVGTG